SNWFPRPSGEPSERVWKADLAVLAGMHRRLRAAVAELADGDLDKVPEGSKTKIVDLVLGVAYHDIYHAGQIQILKRLSQQRQASAF
ncbi:MAG TPA: DinB family protein, partial [Thermoanaerobaculia bacterium]|nr:DinB family protein [Thermoanaerobaculia bacterium]